MAQRLEKIIAVLAFDGVSAFSLSIPALVFNASILRAAPAAPTLRVCAAEGGALQTSAGFAIDTPFGLEGVAGADIVIVPSWRDPGEAPPQAMLDAIRAAHRAGAKIVGLCLGVFVVAATGLLDGRTAVTHHEWLELLGTLHPALRVNGDALYIDHGDVLVSAGVTAGIDCCLHLLHAEYGEEIANDVARYLTLPVRWQAGQIQAAQRIDHTATAAAKRLRPLFDWLRANLDGQHDARRLADRAAMSPRTFSRQFRLATGASPANWIMRQRLARARRLLETTGRPVEEIAWEVGFASSMSMRQHFQSQYQLSPAKYRKQFHATA